MLLTRDVRAELERPQRIDITTRGRRTGQPRRIELVFHNIGGRILISGRPGFPRGWVANLRADPRMTFHLKGRLVVDLPARGRVIEDRAEREELLRPIAATWRTNHALMVRSAPLVEVTFE
ncbi:MAG TPA: nitroreductase/quinone reductase family protein [Candidatus Angelobacter sp.]|nr:nitroreductase/quinone reductase family protein [Candidatus Angelobacter sp.]